MSVSKKTDERCCGIDLEGIVHAPGCSGDNWSGTGFSSQCWEEIKPNYMMKEGDLRSLAESVFGTSAYRNLSWDLSNPSVFRIARERLGLEISWLADNLQVEERTVRRWEAGLSPIPDYATKAMALLDEEASSLADVMTESVKPLKTFRTDRGFKESNPDVIYHAKWHRAVVARALELNPKLIVAYSD